jgi:hypothetical protein
LQGAAVNRRDSSAIPSTNAANHGTSRLPSEPGGSWPLPAGSAAAGWWRRRRGAPAICGSASRRGYQQNANNSPAKLQRGACKITTDAHVPAVPLYLNVTGQQCRFSITNAGTTVPVFSNSRNRDSHKISTTISGTVGLPTRCAECSRKVISNRFLGDIQSGACNNSRDNHKVISNRFLRDSQPQESSNPAKLRDSHTGYQPPLSQGTATATGSTTAIAVLPKLPTITLRYSHKGAATIISGDGNRNYEHQGGKYGQPARGASLRVRAQPAPQQQYVSES